MQRIPLDRCHLYGIGSPCALAKRLGWELAKLEELAGSAKYRQFTLKGTSREVQEPPPALQSLHRQIHKYLSRIETPHYLHSAVKGRSYITNARAHVGCERMIKIDIKKFFPSVPQHKVMHFFRDRMNCAPDVAGLLANLICWNSKLATGSSASPIVSYYTYKSLFDEIEQIAQTHQLQMSCYVDDLTLSGAGASRRVLHEIRTAILKAGLRAHKAKFFEGRQPKLVTGVMVGTDGLHLPFCRWKAIRADEALVAATLDGDEKVSLLNRLVSRLYEAAQLDSSCRYLAERHHQTLRDLKQRMRLAA